MLADASHAYVIDKKSSSKVYIFQKFLTKKKREQNIPISKVGILIIM